MIGYLLVFDRARGVLLRQAEFTDRAAALTARFAAEREFRGQSDVEVVVLNAKSESDLHRTHRRYFENVRDLMSTTARTR